MSEVLLPFTRQMEKVTFYSRSLQFVTMEFRFTEADIVYSVSV